MTKPDSDELKPVFPPGFQRDAETLLLLCTQKRISTSELRRNLRRLGVELDPDPVPPRIARPALTRDWEPHDTDDTLEG